MNYTEDKSDTVIPHKKGRKPVPVQIQVDSVRSLLFQFQRSGSKDQNLSDPNRKTYGDDWIPPEQGFSKLNFDGAWSYQRRSAGAGFLVRNHHGEVIEARGVPIDLGTGAKEIEGQSLKMGVEMALELGLKHIIIEGDAQMLMYQVSHLHKVEVRENLLSDLFLEIEELRKSFTKVIWRWAPRSANQAAHALASKALSLKTKMGWKKESQPL